MFKLNLILTPILIFFFGHTILKVDLKCATEEEVFDLREVKWHKGTHDLSKGIGASVHCWWECQMVQLLWKNCMGFPPKLNTELTYDPEIPLLGIGPKELEVETRIFEHPCLFMVACFTIAKKWKQSTCPLTDEQVNKMCFTYIVDYYSTLKGKEILMHDWTLKPCDISEIN